MQEPTDEFKRNLKIAFDSINVGQTFTFRRTFTEGDVTLFCGVTGDFNPYHMDETFIRESWFGRKIIPGLLTGSMLTHIGGLIGFLATEMVFEFTQAVYIGDTITCTITFTEKDKGKRWLKAEATYINQDNIEVLRARFKGFPAQVRLAR